MKSIFRPLILAFTLAALALPIAAQTIVRSHYVTATALPGGDGTAGAPWTLLEALAHPAAVKPGDTIWVKGGLYEKRHPDIWQPALRGTVEQPIILRAMPGERVQVTGPWRIFGADAWYWGLEHTYTGTESRVSAEPGSGPTDQPVRGWVAIYGDRVKLINPVIHDLNEGVNMFGAGVGREVYGAIIYNVGWHGTDRGNGNGMYLQSSAGVQYVTDSISFNSFSTAMKGYGTAGAVKGLVFDGVMNFNAGAYAVDTPSQRGPSQNLLITTEQIPPDGISVTNSAFYHSAWQRGNGATNIGIGRGDEQGGSVTVRNNYLAGGGGLGIANFATVDVQQNLVYARSIEGEQRHLASSRITAAGAAWDRNAYFDGTHPWAGDGRTYSFGAAQADRIWQGVGRSGLLGWRETTGYDANSTYTVGRPTGTKVIVRPNRYEVGRAHIAVYNWGGAATVSADCSTVGLVSGDRYMVSDVQNLMGPPVASGTYDGKPIALPMTMTTVARATGMSWEPKHTAPEFAVFVLRKTQSAMGSSFLLRIFTDAQGRFLRAEPVEPMQ